jgi:hypothetical protein
VQWRGNVTATVIERSFDWINARFVLSNVQKNNMLMSQLEDLIDSGLLQGYVTLADGDFFSKNVVKRFHRSMLIPVKTAIVRPLRLTGSSIRLFGQFPMIIA